MPRILQHGIYEFELPDSWEDASEVVLFGRGEANFRPNLLVSKEAAEKDENARQFALRRLPQLQQLESFALLKQGDTQLAKRRGYLREFTFSAKGRKFAQLHYYWVQRSIVYTLSFTHVAERFEGHRAEVMKLFASFKARDE